MARQNSEAEKKAGLCVEEVKAIAEEGFIYGLPLVMNYTANYQFWLDKGPSPAHRSSFQPGGIWRIESMIR